MRTVSPPQALFICIIVYLLAGASAQYAPPAEEGVSYTNETVLEGLIEIWEADNFEKNTGRLWVTLTSSPQTTHHLVFPSEDQIDNLRTGQLLRVSGKRIHAHEVGWMLSETHLPVEVTHYALLRDVIEPEEEDPKAKFHRAAQDRVDLYGADTRRLIAIIVDFEDATVDCNKEQIGRFLWGTPEDDDRIDVFGPVKIPISLKSEARCRPEDWAFAANFAAAAAGISIREYRHHMYILPNSEYLQHSLCGWNGLGNVGCGLYCKTWISTCDKLGVYVHELGHNMGFRHSASNPDMQGPYVEYGDPASIMGNSWWASNNIFYINAPHRIQNGWIDSGHVQRIEQNGVYAMTAFNTELRNLPAALTFAAPDLSFMNPRPYYVLSYSTGQNVAFADKLQVHVVYNTSSPSQFIGFLDQPGQFWRDRSLSFAFRLESINSGQATIKAFFGCEAGELSVTLSPTSVVSIPSFPEFHNVTATNTTFSKRADPIIIDVLNTTMPNTTTLVGYMPDYLRKYNVSLRVFNGDSPLCTPVEFHHSVVSLPQDWKIQCYPNMTLLLRGQQACNLDCVVETPVIASTTSFDVIHSFAVQLDGTSTYPSDLRNATAYVAVVYPYQCQRSTPTFVTIDTNTTLYRPDVNTSIAMPSVAMAPSSSRTLSFSMSNNDSRKCPNRPLVIEAVFDDAGWLTDWTNNQLEVVLTHDIALTISVTFTSPADAKEGFFYPVHFYVREQGEMVQRITVFITAVRPCVAISPAVNIWPPVTQGSRILTRGSGRILVHVTHAATSPLCGPAKFQVTAQTTDSRLLHTIFPSVSDRDIMPGETNVHLVGLTASDVGFDVASDVVNVTMSIKDLYSTNEPVVATLPVDLVSTECVRRAPDIFLRCLNGFALDDSSVTTVLTCTVQYINRDNWPCPVTQLDFSMELGLDNITQLTLSNGTFDLNTIMVVPQNGSIQNLKISFDPAPLLSIVTEDYYEAVTWSVSVFTGVSYDTNPAIPIVRTAKLEIGRCKRVVPSFSVYPESANVFSYGNGAIGWRFRVQSWNNVFCGDTTYALSVSQESAAQLVAQGIPAPPGGQRLNTGDISVGYRTPVTFDGTVNITWIITDTRNTSFTANVTTFWTLSTYCIYAPPTIRMIADEVQSVFPFGAAQQFEVKVNVTNMDGANCTAATFGITGTHDRGSTPVGGMILVATDPPSATLLPGESAVSTVTVKIADRAPPSQYGISVRASNYEGIRNAAVSHSFQYECPAPRPVWNVRLTEQISSLGVLSGIFLSWEGCSRPGDCCCPCEFEIERSGQTIAKTAARNYTYTPTLSQVGNEFEFAVHVYDQAGRKSTSQTCGIKSEIRVRSSDLDFVVVLIMLVGVMALPLLVFVMERLRTRNCILYQE